jgi:hypothetical protein
MASKSSKNILSLHFVFKLDVILFSLQFLFGFNSYSFCQDKEIKILKTCTLPDQLIETSGLIYFNHLIWSFNDSGGEPELYALSEKDNKVVKRVTLWNGFNYDWEDITQDSSYIYIGDIGNNFGNRGKLCIYRIHKNGLYKKGNQAVKASQITFTYPDYKPGSIFKMKKSSFDCEAMIYKNDSIYLFSKDWNTNHTTVYSLPAVPGDYIAHKICSFNVNGLVTAADYDGRQLILLGYKDYKAFLWIFKNISDLNLNKQKSKRIELTEFGGAQTEGIAIKGAETFYISCEKSSLPQSLWEVSLK